MPRISLGQPCEVVVRSGIVVAASSWHAMESSAGNGGCEKRKGEGTEKVSVPLSCARNQWRSLFTAAARGSIRTLRAASLRRRHAMESAAGFGGHEGI